ncbi:CCA tRNA nucleotidyltransferase [Sneathiella litorea]|uniref:CCA tRNA nucleotidyltransferase n=1 Tax=Sneathiella litorea TaxID=2606216 RepID=A0A6L8W7B7_9PROT|nr:CCA tRNA nucleotidyltransferase [Sneathiella litorea]MZR30117.1 CCA tRNA nucleotidyltransferase [Sneathiella litorea]
MPNGRMLTDIVAHPPAWWRWPETKAVINALRNEGGSARFVGGCVRDALLGLATEDIDIATDLLPGSVIQGLERANILALPTGLDHGTITAVLNKRHFEITTLRVDLVGHGRHADIAFTRDWERDAERRDFTINALYLDPEGELIDPVGGLADLKMSHIRFIGNADDRIREDRLRVLRFFRFFARFGDDNPDQHALHACARAAGQLDTLSVERVQKELMLLLDTQNPVAALDLMEETGVLEAIIGRKPDLSMLRLLLSLEVPSDALQRFAALLCVQMDDVLKLANKLRFSNNQKQRLAVMCAGDVKENMSVQELREALYQLGKKGFEDQVMMLWAQIGAGKDLSSYLLEAASWQAPQLPVTGSDLLSHGIAEGAELGNLLRKMEVHWIASGFKSTKAELLREVLPDA